MANGIFIFKESEQAVVAWHSVRTGRGNQSNGLRPLTRNPVSAAIFSTWGKIMKNIFAVFVFFLFSDVGYAQNATCLDFTGSWECTDQNPPSYQYYRYDRAFESHTGHGCSAIAGVGGGLEFEDLYQIDGLETTLQVEDKNQILRSVRKAEYLSPDMTSIHIHDERSKLDKLTGVTTKTLLDNVRTLKHSDVMVDKNFATIDGITVLDFSCELKKISNDPGN